MDVKTKEELKVAKKLLKKHGFKPENDALISRLAPYFETDYPQPHVRYSITYESFGASMEESYFWVMNHLRVDLGFPLCKKIKDVFASSEQSSFWGQAQQRLSIQQDRVQQYLATIGKLVKDLFQLVRELRVLDERLRYYKDIKAADIKLSEAADITLKGYWIDLVEGGSKNPGSVLGLAAQVGFGTLPDLFFQTHVKKDEEIKPAVDKLRFNVKVKEVLKRKLKAYLVWQKHTELELQQRRRFQIKFLRQHYDSIQLYINWVRPYLKSVKRLQQGTKSETSSDLIAAFESALMELEFVTIANFGSYNACVLCSFEFVAKPMMQFHPPDNYQAKGPVHVGRLNMQMRAYSWTDEQIEAYIKYRQEEDMEMLSDVDASLKEAIDALGDELRDYLKEAGEKFPEDKEELPVKRPEKSVYEPFMDVGKGFGEIFGSLNPFVGKGGGKKGEKSDYFKGKDRGKAKGVAMALTHVVYKNYKKSHGCVMW